MPASFTVRTAGERSAAMLRLPFARDHADGIARMQGLRSEGTGEGIGSVRRLLGHLLADRWLRRGEEGT
jgi:hypothetical protein